MSAEQPDISTASSTSAFRRGLSAFWQSLISPKILLSNMTAAAIIAILNITGAISVGALIFSGPLSPYLSMGIGLILLGNLYTALVVPAFSSYRANIASVRTGQAPILAAIVTAIAMSMHGQPLENIAVTATVALLTATILIGILFYVLGVAKLGTLARYIPYPVMGGFFAGLGFLTALGGMVVALGPIAAVTEPASLFALDPLVHLAPAFGFAVLLLALEKRIGHWLLVPTYLLVALLAFYAVLAATGTGIGEAALAHWLPGGRDQQATFFPVIIPAQLSLVDWGVIAQQAGTFAALALLSVIMLLLDVSGIEIVINRDLDPNRELRAAGVANILSGFGAGSLSFQSLSDTSLAHKLGGNRFIMIGVYALITLGVIWSGPSLIAYVPTYILGGLLLYVGISMLLQWTWHARRRLPLGDYLVVLCILFVVARYGILEGVGTGIALATVLFVHKYSRLSVIKSAMRGTEFMSNIDRHADDQAFLDKNGDTLRIFILQGYLFFGSASRLLEQIRSAMEQVDGPKTHYLVLDFSRVDDMDSSAANSFSKLMQICHRDRIALVISGASDDILSRLGASAKELSLAPGSIQFFKELDEGVGWCNDELLKSFSREAIDENLDAHSLLRGLMANNAAASAITRALTTHDKPAGGLLFRQNDEGDALYFILKGTISVILDLPNGQSLTVRTMRAGSILGEMSLYTGAPRTASAKVRDDCTVLKLSREDFDNLQAKHPTEMAAFHSYVIRMMADRLRRANREITALTR